MKCKAAHYFFLSTLLFLISCSTRDDKRKDSLFTSLQSSESGINFSNDVKDTDSSHSFINEFGYMGGGVGIGDFNNDGLKDIFFTGNQVSCRAYINKGNNQFEDITEKAGLLTNIWATGVSIVDINHDGFDDVYVCVFGKNLLQRAKNLLFINQHNLTFLEQAEQYGLADTGYSTQAAFLDYDRDGDLDMYLANYFIGGNSSNVIVPRDRSGHSPANDRLYRNNGDSAGHPSFSDVSFQAGIKEDGYGLGTAVSDYNNDGWPDIYVTNDFLSNDELWLNNKNGTFTNCISSSLRHQSYSSMGVDAADINNDVKIDIATLDMLPEYNERKKTSFFFMNYERYQAERRMGYEPEFARNMLQLNNGTYFSGDSSLPFYSEIGQLAGIQATDWSWSVLLADFDNDGWKDMHVTNGIGRDFINGDFLEFSSEVFNNNQSKQKQEQAIRARLAALKHVNLPNYLFLNHHDCTFEDVSENAGVNEPSMSNGAAYADLDNDGDLDLVVNNINKEAFIFINKTVQPNQLPLNHFVNIQLKGNSLNTRGIGARVIIYCDSLTQMQEQFPVRGYFSSVDTKLVFGLGRAAQVDSIIVIWPDEKKQRLINVPSDTTVVFSWEQKEYAVPSASLNQSLYFNDITAASGISFLHHDNSSYNDFAVQRLLPQKYSQLGPFITVGDINNDGAEDFFIGNGFNFQGEIFSQQKDQSFLLKDLASGIKWEEDVDCVLFDTDNDGDRDLLVTGGDLQYSERSPYYRPRLYQNDGKGNFTLNPMAIDSSINTIAGCVVVADYDQDGDLDVFIGGRVSNNYPLIPRSFLLENNAGVFKDVTHKLCASLEKAGMITSAVWTDFDNDKQTDLVIAGEWMPIRFFKNTKQGFTEVTNSNGLTQMNGMWRSLVSEDIDNDGDMDLVAGNLGLNCIYQVSEAMPLELYATDLDRNGTIDPVPFYYIKEENGGRASFPAISRSQFADQVPSIKKQFLRYKDYAHAGFEDVFKGKKDNLLKFHCNETRSCYFENTGGGEFVKHILPMEAQFAPMNTILCTDVDQDGYKDLLLGGNEYQADVVSGRYDASYGCFLRGIRGGTFTTVPYTQSGLQINGDVKDLALLRLANGERLVLAAVNNDSLRVYRINKEKK